MPIFETILLTVFITATVVNLGYWLLIFSKLAFYKNERRETRDEKRANEPLVSIVICAKNEAENLRKFLPRILNQSYRSKELVLINDGSTDDTWEVLQDFQKKHSTFRIIIFSNTLKQFIGKKEALLKGVEKASGEVILVTDADCEPKSTEWISEMVKAIDEEKEIGLGFSPYRKFPGWLNRWIRFEAVWTAIQYFSFALAGKPYMGVGRNMIYKKKLIEKVQGFREHIHIASGDDDLFVNAVANSKNTAILLSENSFVISEPGHTWNAYYRQKNRHMTAGRLYKKEHQLLLGGLAASHGLHYLGGMFLLYIKVSTIFVFSLYVLRTVVVVFLYARILRKLRDSSLLIWIPLFDFLLNFYYLLFSTSFFKRKTRQWK